ncbi:MAG: hypothetical protein DI539_12955, partial [Flavobacterium psychrophilum]
IASAKVAPFSTSANFKQPFFYFILTFSYNSLICDVLESKVFSMFFHQQPHYFEKYAKTTLSLI